MTNSTVDGTIRYPQPGRCWVVFDPGLADTDPLDALRAAFAASRALSPVWRSTSEHDTAAQLAAAAVCEQADRVVVIGDEATIRAVASALANTGVALGVVPVGSGRSLVRSIGAPTDHDDAIAIQHTPPRRLEGNTERIARDRRAPARHAQRRYFSSCPRSRTAPVSADVTSAA